MTLIFPKMSKNKLNAKWTLGIFYVPTIDVYRSACIVMGLRIAKVEKMKVTIVKITHAQDTIAVEDLNTTSVLTSTRSAIPNQTVHKKMTKRCVVI